MIKKTQMIGSRQGVVLYINKIVIIFSQCVCEYKLKIFKLYGAKGQQFNDVGIYSLSKILKYIFLNFIFISIYHN